MLIYIFIIITPSFFAECVGVFCCCTSINISFAVFFLLLTFSLSLTLTKNLKTNLFRFFLTHTEVFDHAEISRLSAGVHVNIEWTTMKWMSDTITTTTSTATITQWGLKNTTNRQTLFIYECVCIQTNSTNDLNRFLRTLDWVDEKRKNWYKCTHTYNNITSMLKPKKKKHRPHE